MYLCYANWRGGKGGKGKSVATIRKTAHIFVATIQKTSIFVATLCSYMKTKQIGVRFDKDLLEYLKEKKIASTPQKALNEYETIYRKWVAGLFTEFENKIKSIPEPIEPPKTDIKEKIESTGLILDRNKVLIEPAEGTQAHFLRYGEFYKKDLKS